MSEPRITIVSGFLGAGKTTLLRQLIVRSLARGERSVVIENEFGSVGLDAALLAQSGVAVHELNQGCICCTLKADFAATLTSILALDPAPDRIFFEPSGIFIPDSVLEILGSPPFATACRLESFITVVDALRLSKGNPMFHDFLRRQTRYADHLAISKAGDEATRTEVLARLAALNPTARLRFAPRQGMDAAELDALLEPTPGSRSVQSPRFQAKATPGHGLEMVTLAFPEGLSEAGARDYLGRLSDPSVGTVLRAKGRVSVGGVWVELSWVDGVVDFEPTSGPLPDSEGQGQLVVIGRALAL